MFKTIFRYVVIGIIAYLLADFLNVLLPFPTEEMMDGFLNPDESEKDYKILIMMRYVVWIFVLDVAYRIGAPLFGFLMPKARRYAESKLLRRVQGIIMELFVFAMIISLVMYLSGLIYLFPKQHEKHAKFIAELTDTDVELVLLTAEERDTLVERSLSELEELTEAGNTWITKQIAPSFEFGKHVFGQSGKKDPKYAPERSWFRVPYRVNRYPGRHKNWEAFTTRGKSWRKNVMDEEGYESRKDRHSRKADSHIRLYGHVLETNRQWEEIKQQKRKSFFSYYAEVFDGAWWFIVIFSMFVYGLTHIEETRPAFAQIYGPVVRFFEQGRFGLGGSARFAGLIEEWAELFDNQTHGLFLGKSLYNPFLRIGSEDPRHMLTIASTRAGKGASAIIPNLILWRGSAIVIDPKGTNAKVTAKRRKKFGDVHVIDPFAETGEDAMGFAASFNPLQGLNPDAPDIRERVYSIADALVVPDPEAREKHWDDGARTVIAGLIGHLVSSPVYEKPTLSMIRAFLTQSPKEQEELWVDMMLNEGAGGLPKDCASRVLRGIETNEIASILSNANKHTEWLSSPAMKNVLNESTFDFATMKEKPTSIYLVLPPKQLVNHNRFLRLFINVALNEMTEGGRSKVPVLCIMDEFLSLGKMEEVEKGFGLLAGYNLIMWPFIQDLSSLKKLYGEGASAFLNNCRAVQVFGVSDPETTGYVSERLGERSLDGVMDTEKRQRRNVNLRMKSEVALDISTYSDRQYVLRAGLAPLLLEKEYYYNSSKFKGLYEKDPDYS